MDSEVFSLLNEISEIHRKTKDAATKLGNAGVAWQPGAPDTNSASVIITHMCGSEMQWIGEYVGGKPANRNRENEFKSPETTVKGLSALIDSTEAASLCAALSGHSALSLSRLATARPNYNGTMRDCVLHAIVHLSEHAGHLDLTEQLWRASKA